MKNKTKYKLNVYKGGTIFANNIFELVHKIIFKKYATPNNSRTKRSA